MSLEKYRADSRRWLLQAKRLDKLYIPTRYPNGLPDLTPSEVYTAEEAEAAIEAASEVLALAEELTG